MSAVLTPADRALASGIAQAHPLSKIVGKYSAIVRPWGFDIEVTYDYDEGEPAIYWPTEHAHPGTAPAVFLQTAKHKGDSIYWMLDNEQIERIEDAILRQEEA